ncbi:hypothetical protein O988_05212 [Pseudogymnoascus sp. VKM F-3808]|nr:hypothetical protein O988_05212 [Pseudogymnoascus sp. VKM F-3808]
MLFYKLLSVAAFSCLAAGQPQPNGPLATFSTYEGEKFDIKTRDCVNFKRSQPIYNNLDVNLPFVCQLYAERDCHDETDQLYPGHYDITEKVFKSVQCN